MSERFLRAILAGDRSSALEQARQALREKGLAYVYEELVDPALVQVGSLWQKDAISVADEHVASAVVQATMAALYPEVAWPPAHGPVVVVAAIAGEQHTVGTRMAADLLALDGWDDVFLGGDVPPRALAEKARDASALVAALSITMPDRLPILRETVRALREISPKTKILVGGRVTPELGTREELGVDAVAVSASEGAREARRWKA